MAPDASPSPPDPRQFLTPRRIVATGLALVLLCFALDPIQAERPVTRYIVPPGTAARVQAGESVEDVLPSRVTTRVGRRLEVTNQDAVDHVFGPFVLAPGQTWTREFATAGKVSMACSVYPATGFVVEVLPAENGRDLPTFLWELLVVGGLFCGGYLAALLSAGPRGSAGVGWLPRAATFSRQVVALVFVAALAEVSVLLRLVSPSAAIQTVLSRPTIPAIGVAVLIAWLVSRVRDERLREPPWLGIAAHLPLISGALLLLPSSSMRALPAALGWVGWGLVAFAVRRWLANWRGSLLLAIGAMMLVLASGLPAQWTPRALPAKIVELAGILVILIILPRLLRFRGWPPDSPLVRSWQVLRHWLVVAAFYVLFIFLAAAVAHVSATTLPMAGNPVRADAGSIDRGAEIWRGQCASCHPASLDAAGKSDHELLEVITFGRGTMPGFAYELDIDSRGDVVNYLRSR